jgi:hypothetical protein
VICRDGQHMVVGQVKRVAFDRIDADRSGVPCQYVMYAVCGADVRKTPLQRLGGVDSDVCNGRSLLLAQVAKLLRAESYFQGLRTSSLRLIAAGCRLPRSAPPTLCGRSGTPDRPEGQEDARWEAGRRGLRIRPRSLKAPPRSTARTRLDDMCIILATTGGGSTRYCSPRTGASRFALPPAIASLCANSRYRTQGTVLVFSASDLSVYLGT